MKSILKLLALNCAIFFVSCSGETSTEVNQNQIKDDFTYITVNSTGKINKIGNNTGAISSYSEFNGVNPSSFLNLNTISSNANKIFLVEHLPPKDKLFVFDKNTNSTISKELIYPIAITGTEPTLVSLQWNELTNQLFAVIASNPNLNGDDLCYFVTINLVNFEVNYTGISFNQKGSFSTFINDNKFYSTSINDQTIEINPENNTSKPLRFNSTNSSVLFTKAGMSSNNILFGVKAATGNVIGVSLVKFDLTSNITTAILPNEVYGIINSSGKGFIDKTNNQYVNYVIKEKQTGLLKYNISSNSTEFVAVNKSGIDNNMIIIEKASN
ncbi:hypothetical protein [Flavobacterium xinjiangense]|uniref:Lipoprotein n=1 Tax=Flavobacterium xinjiangense TaxID=178356 RepID=A0A1M7I7D0_9FLAO|nr:hypothetical protein [Flavobacterium xinjiangense]SHM36529.1 hypothetical protein SAMN05216269_10431 [Flavobacterium xinjiangense]